MRLLLTKLGVNPRELPAPLISENIPRPTKQALTAVFENIEQAYYDDAIGGLTKTIKNNPKFGPAYFYRGYILEIQAWERNAEKINADYTKAIELDSTFVEAYLSRARFAFFHHQEVNSRTDIARAIALNPKSARAVYYRSIFTYGQDNRTKELSDLNLALKLNPNFAEAYFTRGLFFELIKKQYDKAISDYSAILKINPNDILAYYQRAKVYCEANKKELAAADERKVVELGGNIDSPCTKN